MFQTLRNTDSKNSKIKNIIVKDKPLTFMLIDEVSDICFKGGSDKLKLSLIRTDDSDYSKMLDQLSALLSEKVKNFHETISQEKYAKITIDLDRSKVYSSDGKYALNKIKMK